MNEWISVKERLPALEDNRWGNFFVMIDGHPDFSPFSFYKDGGGNFTVELMDGLKVTHWMPLPEPPK